MEQRRRIIITTGNEPEGALPTPHFDAEATLLARPVVPLTPDAVESARGTHAGAAKKPLARRFPLLALIVLVALGVGVAGGLAIGLYQNRRKTEPAVAAQPPTVAPTVNPRVTKPAQEVSRAQPPSAPPVVKEEKPAPQPSPVTLATAVENAPLTPATTAAKAPSPSVTKDEKATDPIARPKVSPAGGYAPREDPTPDGTRIPLPTATRGKSQSDRKSDDYRRQKTQRHRTRSDEESADELPQQTKRPNDGLNRIRDIFEGVRP